MKTLHEYIYYRMTKWHASYFGYERVFGIGVILVSTLYLFYIGIAYKLLTGKPLDSEPCTFIIFLAGCYLNHRYFLNDEKYKKLDKKWGNEPRMKKIICGCLIVVYCLGVLTSLLLVGLLT